MATPMTPSQLLSQLRKWGVPYREYRSWKTHNRNHKGAWGPVNGFMVHHTGSDSKDQRELLYNGVSGLPGPLSQFGLAQDGTVHLIGHGRANHAGAGDPDVLAAVIAEDYGQRPPADNESSVDGNARFYGVEIWYSGSHKMTPAQYATLRKLSAAICDFHDWSEKSVIGHGEWGSPGKWDPGYAPGKMMDMSDVRRDVKATLGATAPGKPAPAPAPAPAKPDPVDAYTVKDGDTLSAIGRKLSVDWEELAEVNGLRDPHTIKPGQVLKVPGRTPAPKSKPAPKPATVYVDLSNVVSAARRDPGLRQGGTTHKADALRVERALHAEGLLNAAWVDGSFGTKTREAYSRWQRRCGYRGTAADGIPGRASLTKLGARHGWEVKA